MKYNVNLYDKNNNLIYNDVIEANSEEQAIEFALNNFIICNYAKVREV